MTLAKLLASAEFWAALGGAFAGAIAAFLLGLLAQWRAASNANRSAGNLAIVTLAEMYSEAKALQDTLFTRQLPVLRNFLGREPLYFEYKAVIDVPQVSHLAVESLGFLADSHDPDILARLAALRNHYAAMLKLAGTHQTLHAELQARVARQDPSGRTAWRAEEIPGIAGADVMLQLKSMVESLQSGLPESCAAILVVGNQLRDVLRYQLPLRSFLRFIPEDRGNISTAAAHAGSPAAWRRALRWARGLPETLIGVAR